MVNACLAADALSAWNGATKSHILLMQALLRAATRTLKALLRRLGSRKAEPAQFLKDRPPMFKVLHKHHIARLTIREDRPPLSSIGA